MLATDLAPAVGAQDVASSGNRPAAGAAVRWIDEIEKSLRNGADRCGNGDRAEHHSSQFRPGLIGMPALD